MTGDKCDTLCLSNMLGPASPLFVHFSLHKNCFYFFTYFKICVSRWLMFVYNEMFKDRFSF